MIPELLTMTELHIAVNRYIKKGFAIFPLLYADKRPATPHGFKDATNDASIARSLFDKIYNIGIATGEKSNIVVIDVDEREDKQGGDALREIERRIGPLPKTYTVKTGSGFHYYFKYPAGVKTAARISAGIDIKGDGGYVVAPPSRHPLGGIYTVVLNIETVEMPAVWIEEIRAKAIAPRPAPAPVRSPQVYSSIDEAVERYNNNQSPDWPNATKESYVSPCCGHRGCFQRLKDSPHKWICYSSNHPANIGAAVNTYHIGDSLDLDAAAAGRSRLEQLIANDYWSPTARIAHASAESEPVFDDFNALDGEEPDALPDPDSAAAAPRWKKPTLEITKEVRKMVDKTILALVNNPLPEAAKLYKRAGTLVRVCYDRARRLPGMTEEESLKYAPRRMPAIVDADTDYLLEACDRAANFVVYKTRVSKNGDETSWEQRELAPDWLLRCILARRDWPFPEIEGVVESPTLRPRGSVLETEGYDEETRLLYDPGFNKFDKAPDIQSRDEVVRTLCALEDIFVDFPFRSGADRSAIMAGALSVLLRPAISGCVPMFAIRATTPGSGKTLLVNVIEMLRSGRRWCPTCPPTQNEDEEGKRILALAREAAPMVLVDNVRGRFGSPTLDGVLTMGVFKSRLLGTNDAPAYPMRAVWFLTGNNVSFRGDLDRRLILVDLEPDSENPAQSRRSFAHGSGDEFFSYIRKARTSLVPRILAAARYYIQCGAPRALERPLLGSFESWDALVVGMLTWAGWDDPFDTNRRLVEEGDSEKAISGDLVYALACAFPAGERFTVDQIIRACAHNEALRAAAFESAPARVGDTPTTRELGYALRPLKGRIFRGMKLTRDDTRHWRVELLQQPNATLTEP